MEQAGPQRSACLIEIFGAGAPVVVLRLFSQRLPRAILVVPRRFVKSFLHKCTKLFLDVQVFVVDPVPTLVV